MSLSDTPRTDDRLLSMPVIREGRHMLVDVVPIDHARQLERELTAAQERNERLVEALLLSVCGSFDIEVSAVHFDLAAHIFCLAREVLQLLHCLDEFHADFLLGRLLVRCPNC